MDERRAVELYNQSRSDRNNPAAAVVVMPDNTVHSPTCKTVGTDQTVRVMAVTSILDQAAGDCDPLDDYARRETVHGVASLSARLQAVKDQEPSFEGLREVRSILSGLQAYGLDYDILERNLRTTRLELEVALQPDEERERIVFEAGVRCVKREFERTNSATDRSRWDTFIAPNPLADIAAAWETVTLRPEKPDEEIPWIVQHLKKGADHIQHLIKGGEGLEDAARRISAGLTQRLHELLAEPLVTVATYSNPDLPTVSVSGPDETKTLMLWDSWRGGVAVAARVPGAVALGLQDSMWVKLDEDRSEILETFVGVWDAVRFYGIDEMTDPQALDAPQTIMEFPENALQAARDIHA